VPDTCVDSFKRELKALRRLTALGGHPAVVQLLGADPVERRLLLTLGPASTLTDAQIPLSAPDKMQALMKALVNALAWCHRAGVAHGDIKHENVLFDEKSGAVLLIDFGYARRADRPSRASRGTPYFVPREVLLNTDGRLHSPTLFDSYGLACTLHFAAYGHFPGFGECRTLPELRAYRAKETVADWFAKPVATLTDAQRALLAKLGNPDVKQRLEIRELAPLL